MFIMNTNNKGSVTPPRGFLPVVTKARATYLVWLGIHRNMGRVERFGLGTKIDSNFLSLLGILRKATFLNVEEKIPFLAKALEVVDVIRFFIQLAWEAHCIQDAPFIQISTAIEEIGSMIGGWRNGLIKKTSATRTEEKRV